MSGRKLLKNLLRLVVVVATLWLCLRISDRLDLLPDNLSQVIDYMKVGQGDVSSDSTLPEQEFFSTDESDKITGEPDELEKRAQRVSLEPGSDQSRIRLEPATNQPKIEGKQISLTFDDGPHPTVTPLVLEVLREHGVQATFFVLGANVDHYPELARQIVEEGHIIANHSYGHPDLSSLSDQEVIDEMDKGQEAIRRATGVQADLYRLPYGRGGARVVRLLPDYTSIIWNMDTLDWQTRNEEMIVDQTLSNLLDDGILLMHDVHEATPKALARIIPELKSRGYRFVSPTEVDFDMRYYTE